MIKKLLVDIPEEGPLPGGHHYEQEEQFISLSASHYTPCLNQNSTFSQDASLVLIKGKILRGLVEEGATSYHLLIENPQQF